MSGKSAAAKRRYDLRRRRVLTTVSFYCSRDFKMELEETCHRLGVTMGAFCQSMTKKGIKYFHEKEMA